MFFSDVTSWGATPALAATLAYGEERLRMIAANVANAHTPGYRAKHLDARAFQRALGEALEQRHGKPSEPLIVEVDRQVRTDPHGRLQITPTEPPVENILFHDGTNLSMERQMADLAETGMMHDAAANLLRARFDGLRKAIRGTVG